MKQYVEVIITTAALAFLIVGNVSCAASSPAASSQTQTSPSPGGGDGTSAAAPTTTPTLAPTPKSGPVPKSTLTPTTAPSPTPTPEPTPQPRETPAAELPSVKYVGSKLWGLLQRNLGGDTSLPDTLVVSFAAHEKSVDTTLEEHILRRGGVDFGDGSSWAIPTDQVLPLIQRSDIKEVRLLFPDRHPYTIEETGLTGVLADITAIHSGNPSKYVLFARNDKDAVIAYTTHTSQADDVREWLIDENIFSHDREIIGDRPQDVVVVFLPMATMSALLAAPEFAGLWVGTEPASDNRN